MTLQTPDTANRPRQGDISHFSLLVPDVQRALRFFGAVLGWKYSGPADRPLVEGQSISHGIAELRGTADYLRRMGVPLPELSEPMTYPVFVVDDINAAIERVRAAGGWAGSPFQQPYGSIAECIDDQGMSFALNQLPAGMPGARPPASGARQGDIAYLVFQTPDAARARAFLGSAFGLQFTPGRSADGWNIAEMTPMAGLSGGHTRSTVVPMYRVDDIQAAVERVRAAGGTASEPTTEGYGRRADCVDDQGLRFMLGQF